jgi:hypothetical protein
LEDILEGKLEVESKPDAVESLRKLYGQKLFRCRQPSCPMSLTEGFETASQRNQHEDKHQRPYKCPSEDCFYNEVGFSSKQKLQGHKREHHGTQAIFQKGVVKNLEVLSVISQKLKFSC